VHTAVWVPEDVRAFATRLARYCARNPVAPERLTYDRSAKAVTYRSDKSDGPTAGTATAAPLEFLARVLVHISDKGHVTTRCYGWYANRPRGHAGEGGASNGGRATHDGCRAAMRLVACITQTSVIDQILTHLRAHAAHAAHAGARSPPSTRARPNRGASRAARQSPDAPTPP
jgi:hypothetical protein